MSVIKETLTEFPIVLITGARQTGKTTMLKNELPGYEYITLDDKGSRLYASEDPVGFLNDLSAPVIIDEIQYAPEILEVIKKRVDEADQSPGMFVLTGSHRFDIMKGVTESLAGRLAIFQLPPLSLREIDSGIKNSLLFSEYDTTEKDYTKEDTQKNMLRSMYPKTIFLSKTKIWYESYIRTYIERDVTQIINIKDKGRFKNFITLLATRVGQPFNQSDLSKRVGVDSKTIVSWLHTLEMSDIVFLLYPWHRREGLKVIKSPKVYFLDTGLCCYMNNINTEKKLIKSELRGFLFENHVISEIIKTFWNRGEKARCNYWRTYDKSEVDLLVETDEGLTAIEFKMTQTPQKKHIIHLRRFIEKFPECDQGFVVSNVSGRIKVSSEISYINSAQVV